MPLKLARFIVSDGAVSAQAMEEALRRQVVEGGALDTILLEMGLVAEDQALGFMARLTGLPVTNPAQLALDPKAIALFPLKLAAKHGMVPLALGSRKLEVGICYPAESKVMEELSFLLGRDLSVKLAVELRLRQAIARAYGAPLQPRFSTLAIKLDAAQLVDKVPGEPPAPYVITGASPGAAQGPGDWKMKEPDAELASPELLKQLAQTVNRPQAAPQELSQEVWRIAEIAAARVADEPLSAEVAEPEPEAAASDPALSWSLAEAKAVLEACQSRDEIFGVVLRYAMRSFEFAAVFGAVGGSAVGWGCRASGADGQSLSVSHIALPLDIPSVLHTVVMTAGRYLGPLPDDPVTETLVADIGRPRPKLAFVYPIEIRRRVVALVYGESGPRSIPHRRVSDFCVFAQEVPRAFERLILERKRKLSEARWEPPEGPEPAPATAEARTLADRARSAISWPLEAEVSPVESQLQAAVDAEPVAAELPRAPGTLGGEDAPFLLTQRRAAVVPQAQAAAGDDVAQPSPLPEGEGADARALVAHLVGPDAGLRVQALNALLRNPEAAVPALAASFPGPVSVAKVPVLDLPDPEQVGPIPAALATMGRAAMPALSNLMGSPDESARYYALLVAGRMGAPELLLHIVTRVFDLSPDVASAARAAAAASRNLRGFGDAMGMVRAVLGSSDPGRLASACLALGQLQDVPSVEPLIRLAGSAHGEVAVAAAAALRSITLQRFGSNGREWSAWWAENRARPRMAWLIDALSDADGEIRQAAIEELTVLTGDNLGYFADAPHPARDRAIGRWQEWWGSESVQSHFGR